MADVFLASADGRKKSPAYEVRWLNLCGFCLRPGFGFPGDDFRIEQARRIYAGGIAYSATRCRTRSTGGSSGGGVAGGLNRNQQADIYQRLSGVLLPRGSKKPQRVNPACCARCGARRRAWNCCPSGRRPSWAMRWRRRVKTGDFRESELWCLSRIGARKLFYGPINLVIPPATATRWVEALMGAGGNAGAGARVGGWGRAGGYGAPDGGCHSRSFTCDTRGGAEQAGDSAAFGAVAGGA